MKTLNSSASPLAADFIDSVGMNIHLAQFGTPYYDHFDSVLGFLQDLGIGHIRNDAFYVTTVLADGHHFYERIRILVGNKIKACIVLHDPLNGYLYAPPSQIENIYNWCNGGVEFFEGGNEPNLGANPSLNPLISYEHQLGVFNAVKKLPANIPVVAPSYIQGNVPLALPSSNVVDLINLHTYCGSEHPETTGNGSLLGFASYTRSIFGEKPMIVTENGYHTAVAAPGFFFGVTEGIKTRYIPRMLLFAFINGMKKTYIYQLIDQSAPDAYDPEANFGLVDYNLNKKASYNSLKNLLDLFRSSADQPTNSPNFTVTASGSIQTAMFKRDDGKTLLAAWLGVSGWDPVTKTAIAPVTQSVSVTVSPAPTATTSHLFNDDGTVTSTQLTACGSFDLTVSDQLTVLEIT